MEWMEFSALSSACPSVLRQENEFWLDIFGGICWSFSAPFLEKQYQSPFGGHYGRLDMSRRSYLHL
jgi:hypothetical protein